MSFPNEVVCSCYSLVFAWIGFNFLAE